MSQNQEFVIQVLKILVPFLVGLHIPAPSYTRRNKDDGSAS